MYAGPEYEQRTSSDLAMASNNAALARSGPTLRDKKAVALFHRLDECVREHFAAK